MRAAGLTGRSPAMDLTACNQTTSMIDGLMPLYAELLSPMQPARRSRGGSQPLSMARNLGAQWHRSRDIVETKVATLFQTGWGDIPRCTAMSFSAGFV